MGILKTAAKVAVASSVHGDIQCRQRQRWAAADVIAALERLGKLRDSGVLTEAEFSAQKERLLD